MLLDDQECGTRSAGGSSGGDGSGLGVEMHMAESAVEYEELPPSTLTKCYLPSCVEAAVYFAFACPRHLWVRHSSFPSARIADILRRRTSWRRTRW